MGLSLERINAPEEPHACCGGLSVPHWVRDADLSLLTEREREVLAALGDSQSNMAMAGRLWITERTVHPKPPPSR